MRIAIIATGSRGDVQPYLALGVGLQEDGHFVRVVTHENFKALTGSHGLDFWPIGGDVQSIAQNEAMRARIEGGNFLRLMTQMAREAQRGAILLAEGGLAGCQEMDLLVAGMGGVYIGLAIAEKLDLPLLQAYLVPFTPTRFFPSPLVANMPAPLGPLLNRVTHQMTRQMIWQGFRSADRMARVRVLGLKPANFWGPYASEHTRDYPVIYGFSPSVIAPPPDWPQNVHVTGYWFLDHEQSWIPPAGLTDFLAAGPPPVYIGFGSMSQRRPEETTRLILEVLRATGQRAILLSGWDGLKSSDLPGSAYMIDSAPHEWLFQQVSAVVHHGGAGTTAAGLRAGIPSIIIPFFGDQPFWGRRVAELGVGPEAIPRKKLTSDRLARALETTRADTGMQQRAFGLGEKIRAEKGIQNAVDIFRNL